ncbi:hypothetical protein R6Q57_008832 [Mikania cordata]
MPKSDSKFAKYLNFTILESVQNLRIHTYEKDDEPYSITYPDHPGEPDCVYYQRTGLCGYVMIVNSIIQLAMFSDTYQYFMKTGVCKYGSTCKFNHPRGTGLIVFNTFGLPMREGEDPCSHYLRTGSCIFGFKCKFHHPEPSLDRLNPPISKPLPNAPAVAPACISGAYPWSYLPVNLSSSVRTREWNPYIGNMCPVLSTNSLTCVDQVYPLTPGSHLPERPGEPECSYFMNNGTCKYGSDCKFHHPRKNMVQSDATSFSLFGLPLRPSCDEPMIDPTLLSYDEMNLSDAPLSKSLKNPSLTADQIDNVKLGTDDSSGDFVVSSSSSQNQSN